MIRTYVRACVECLARAKPTLNAYIFQRFTHNKRIHRIFTPFKAEIVLVISKYFHLYFFHASCKFFSCFHFLACSLSLPTFLFAAAAAFIVIGSFISSVYMHVYRRNRQFHECFFCFTTLVSLPSKIKARIRNVKCERTVELA